MAKRKAVSKTRQARAKRVYGLEAAKAITIQQINYLVELSKTRLLDPHELKCLDINSKLLQSLTANEQAEIASVRNEYSQMSDAELERRIKELS